MNHYNWELKVWSKRTYVHTHTHTHTHTHPFPAATSWQKLHWLNSVNEHPRKLCTVCFNEICIEKHSSVFDGLCTLIILCRTCLSLNNPWERWTGQHEWHTSLWGSWFGDAETQVPHCDCPPTSYIWTFLFPVGPSVSTASKAVNTYHR